VTASSDLVALGRLGVDLYPLQVATGLEDVETFGKYLGGSAANVAVATARYGHSAALVSGVGSDPFGRFLLRQLEEYAVSSALVQEVPELPTPVTFCEIFPPDDFPLYFYRRPSAPDLQITLDGPGREACAGARVLWATGTGLSEEPSRGTTLEALALRTHDQLTVLDLDYRPMFWTDPTEATEWVRKALGHVTVAVGNLDEVEVAVGTREPREAARRLRDLGVRLAVVKQGPRGVLAVDDDGEVEVPPVPVEVVNGLGAGDAFGGALCHALLSEWDPERTIRYANAAGAIVASRLACADDMPTREEVEELLERSAGV
jgi:5-dehydro-2-deoxygluconokinase